MSIPRKLLDSICGGDEDCIKKIHDFLAYVDNLEQMIKQLPKPDLENHNPPLIKQVKNLDRLKEKARDLAGGDEDAVNYLIRRRIYLEHGFHVQRDWKEQACPVCSILPTLILYKPSETGLFSGHRPYYRCVCGSEWPGNEWKCPRCGADDRRLFETLILASAVESRRCKRCGYAMPVLEQGLVDTHKLHLLLTLVLSELQEEKHF